MSDEGCVGQVWEDLQEGHIYMVIDRPAPWSDWRVLVLDVGVWRSTGLKPGTITWAGDRFFGASWTRRIA